MAAIPFSALDGQGYLYPFDLPILEHTWVITTPTCSGSAYLTFEAVRLPNGFYDDTSSTPGLATFSDFVGLNIDTLVTSSNIFSVVIPQGGGTFKWVNTNIIPANTMFIRGTGGITITSSSTSYIFTSKAELQTAVNLWISDNTAALATYGEINTWNVSAIVDMSALFEDKTTFNDDISNWDVSNVTNMDLMFANATAFNQNIGTWNVSSVTAMYQMFINATSFNGPINNWNVSNVTDMREMFSFASAFQQPLNLWELDSLTTATLFMGITGGAGAITYTLLDTLLNGWVIDFAALQSNVTISFGDSTFTSAGLAARNILVNDKGWTITDGGQV